MAIKVQFRRGLASQWTSSNPILDQGEIGLETDTNQVKMGDGVTAWNSLGYFDIVGEPSLTKIKFDTSEVTLNNAGEMAWDIDTETVSIKLDSQISTPINQQTLYHVVNETGSTINKGTVVRADGAAGVSGKIKIAPFIANGTFPSQFAMGVAAENIDTGTEGFVVNFGIIRGIDTSTYDVGDVLYASSTVSGGFVANTPPLAPNNNVLIALVIASANNGVIFVRPTYGSSISNDEQVNLTGIASGDGLVYNGSVFVPSQLAPLYFTENVVTANYTLALTDVAKVVAFNSSSNLTLTVPLNSSVAFPVGTVINVYRAGTGTVTIAGASGVTVRNAGTIAAQYGERSLRKRGTDEWVLV